MGMLERISCNRGSDQYPDRAAHRDPIEQLLSGDKLERLYSVYMPGKDQNLYAEKRFWISSVLQSVCDCQYLPIANIGSSII
jgi:hypothetical protein